MHGLLRNLFLYAFEKLSPPLFYNYFLNDIMYDHNIYIRMLGDRMVLYQLMMV